MADLQQVKLTIDDNSTAAKLFGKYDENLKVIEENCEAKIVARGNEILITGTPEMVDNAVALFGQLIKIVESGTLIDVGTINYMAKMLQKTKEGKQPQLQQKGKRVELADTLSEIIYVTSRGKQIKPKTAGQKDYITAIKSHDIVFGIGPAGTGKTYLAVVMAVRALRNKEVQRIILARPAVEAGEKLGFLPGDLQEKVNPYLRPLYDGLYDVLGREIAQKYMEKNIIEIAPLAYMRGRTLEDSFIILDEAQNTTSEQMKMFLTRIGTGSKVVITGDITQIDLPKGAYSGLVEAQNVLSGVEGIAFHYLTEVDVVRHPLVQKIIQAYAEKQR
ncbi:MAG: PhoH family protein [Thermoanaerobacteraceae bacterium]|nr:PhoH family protein [Thermoanaerobacteraceae bacterium]